MEDEGLPLTEELYRVADELRAVACQGLRFTKGCYDRERYERILAASARLIAALDKRPVEEILPRLHDNLWHVSPLAGAEAVVQRSGKLLLIRRADDGLWAVPGGLTEVGEVLAETACRELWEETGLRGRAMRLLGIFDSRLWHSLCKSQLYHVLFEVECDEGLPAPSPEATDAGFFDADELPPLSPGHLLRVPFVFRLLRGEVPVPYFDAGG